MQWAPDKSRAARAASFTAAGLLLLLVSMGTSSSRSRQEQRQRDTPGGGAAAATQLQAATPAQLRNSGAEKVGAGLLLTCGGEVLLLKRTSKNNHGSWGLPGGNADDTDADLLEVATREAREEMGPELPRFQVVESVLTKRGKRGQKHYVVFVARISPEVRASWQPHLNEEHSAWRWFPLAELTAGNTLLHPVVELALMHDPWRRPVLAAVGGQAG